MIEKAEFLEHHAHAPPEAGELVLGDLGDILPEEGDQAARRLDREQDQPQERGLAGSRGAGEELEGIGLDGKGQVAQDLGPHAVTHAHILEMHGWSRAFIVFVVVKRPHAPSNHPDRLKMMTGLARRQAIRPLIACSWLARHKSPARSREASTGLSASRDFAAGHSPLAGTGTRCDCHSRPDRSGGGRKSTIGRIAMDPLPGLRPPGMTAERLLASTEIAAKDIKSV
jgi:hypothetical protein